MRRETAPLSGGRPAAAEEKKLLAPQGCVSPSGPSFVHGNTLVEQTNAEFARQDAAAKKCMEAPVVEPPPGPLAEGLSHRARGWLKHLWAKATAPHGPGTGDDWSVEGGGEPAEWWDKKSMAPMASFPRFDLHESTYALALMAERTPAWREAYVAILDGLVSRYITHWSAVDFLTQFGHDPDRSNYPARWKGTLVFEDHWGKYDTPGWTANGTSPGASGVEPDPIAAQAMLFFKGWLLLTMGIRAKVGGPAKWEAPWQMANVGGAFRDWTHSGVAKVLADQFNSNDGNGLH